MYIYIHINIKIIVDSLLKFFITVFFLEIIFKF